MRLRPEIYVQAINDSFFCEDFVYAARARLAACRASSSHSMSSPGCARLWWYSAMQALAVFPMSRRVAMVAAISMFPARVPLCH